MKKINSKGFTLVELIATIVLLAIIMGIGATSITAVINKSKEKDYQLLINEIKNAVELYYQECRYTNAVRIECPEPVDIIMGNDSYEIKLEELVKYGFIKANAKNDDGENILVNPIDKENIGDCAFQYMYSDGKFYYNTNYAPGSSCPELREE